MVKGITRKAIFALLIVAILLSLAGTFTILESSSEPTAMVVEDQLDDEAGVKLYIEPTEEDIEEEEENNDRSVE